MKEKVQTLNGARCAVPLSEICWIDGPLHVTAVEAQTSWSYGLDVNFLAAGYNNPSVGSAGSGVYAGRTGPIKAIMPTVRTTQLLVANVTKKTFYSSQAVLNYVSNNSKALSYSSTFYLAGLMEINQDFGR